MNTAIRSLAASVVLIVALLGGYVAGYFWMGIAHVTGDGISGCACVVRVYPHKWQVVIFKPAAKFETRWIGTRTIAVHDQNRYQ